jgi:large subunit ribosomal protein L10
MSKYVKELISNELSSRLEGVSDALVVDMVGLDANTNVLLRQQLREQNVRMTVVKNSLARRATEGTPLAAAFQSLEGSTAVVWGAEDIVSLAKVVTKYAEDKNFEGFKPKGGVMDGAPLTADEVKSVSKWPSRQEQLSILVGQILAPGAKLSSQLLGPGGALASQIKQKSEGEEATAAEG